MIRSIVATNQPAARSRRFDGGLSGLEKVLATVAAVALFAMMLLTFCDVIGRTLLAASIPGSVELTELLMLVVIFVALPLTSLRGEHVIFDMLDNLLPDSVRAWQHRLAHMFAAALVSGACWLVYERAGRTVEMGDVTAHLNIGIAPFHYGASLMLGLTALMHLILAWRVAPGSNSPRAGPVKEGECPKP